MASEIFIELIFLLKSLIYLSVQLFFFIKTKFDFFVVYFPSLLKTLNKTFIVIKDSAVQFLKSSATKMAMPIQLIIADRN